MRYRMFTELILTGTMLLTGACQKEKGYTGFMKPSDGEETVISVRTDKAAYKPGETIRFTASATPGADVYVRYMHLAKSSVNNHSIHRNGAGPHRPGTTKGTWPRFTKPHRPARKSLEL